MTQEQREKANKLSQESMELHRKVIDWKLCITFLISSSQLETFVKSNQLEIKLHKIAIKIAHEKDIAKLVFTVFNEFKLQLPNDLQKQMESIFGMLIKKKLILVTKRN